MKTSGNVHNRSTWLFRISLALTLVTFLLSGLPGSLRPVSLRAAQSAQVYGYLPAAGSEQTFTLLPTSKESVITSNRTQASGTTGGTKKKTAEPKPTTRIEEAVLGPNSKRFLTIDPSKADVKVNVTMTFRPSDQTVVGKVNFFMFDENGVRELAAGVRPTAVNVAAGNVVEGSPGELKATVKAVATLPFTIMVENRASQSIVYSLVVSGGKFRPE